MTNLLCLITTISVLFLTASCHWRCGDVTPERTGSNVFADESNEKCYQLVDNEMHWEEAHIHCTNLRGTDGTTRGELAMFEQQKDLQAVRGWLKQINWYRNGVWIGAKRCSRSNNGFCWVNNEPLRHIALSDFWGPFEPADFVHVLFKADCVQLRKSNDWKSFAYPCHASQFVYSFVCQFPMLPLTTPKGQSTRLAQTTRSGPARDPTPSVSQVNSTTKFPTQASEAMAAIGQKPDLTTAQDIHRHGVNMLLVGILCGFGGALLLTILVVVIVWRRRRPDQPVQVIVNSGPNHDEARDDGDLNVDTPINRQLELALQSKEHLGSPTTPPPSYRPQRAIEQERLAAAVIDETKSRFARINTQNA